MRSRMRTAFTSLHMVLFLLLMLAGCDRAAMNAPTVSPESNDPFLPHPLSP